LLVVEDPDPRLMLVIWWGMDTSDERLRALKELDGDVLVDDARLRKARSIQEA
jgi:hypothetical protein